MYLLAIVIGVIIVIIVIFILFIIYIRYWFLLLFLSFLSLFLSIVMDLQITIYSCICLTLSKYIIKFIKYYKLNW
jgi:hypothetical protein